MDAYVYQAALLCKSCGEKTCKELTRMGKQPNDAGGYKFGHDWDSDDYPKGPYPNGGGESDSPQHCDQCQKFLENPLTSDGYVYVEETVKEDLRTGRRNSVAVKEWAPFYDIDTTGKNESINVPGNVMTLQQWSNKYGITFSSFGSEGALYISVSGNFALIDEGMAVWDLFHLNDYVCSSSVSGPGYILVPRRSVGESKLRKERLAAIEALRKKNEPQENIERLVNRILKEDEEFNEPEEGDITTEDHEHWYQYGKLYYTGEEEGLRAKMEADKFWPNIWWISDHGNAHLLGS